VNFVSRNGEPTVANDAWRKLECVVGLDCLGNRHIDVSLEGSQEFVGLDRAWRIIASYGLSRPMIDELGNDRSCAPDAFACSAETRHDLSHTSTHVVFATHHKRRAVNELYPLSLESGHSRLTFLGSFSIDRRAVDRPHVVRSDGDRIVCTHESHAVAIITLAYDYTLPMIVPACLKSKEGNIVSDLEDALRAALGAFQCAPSTLHHGIITSDARVKW